MTNRRRVAQSAFTLIEVMIVIAIILALAGLVGVALFRQKDAATYQLAQTDVKTIQAAMKLFRLDFDRYPMEEEGLKVLWSKEGLDPDAQQGKWKKYLEEPLPKDRWNNEWGYRAESESEDRDYDLWSNGPDGEEGTEDDITSWSDEEGDSEFDFGGGDFGGDGG